MKISAVKKPKDRIVEVSAKLFYEHDSHTVGVDKICEVANVSKRTLYKHFPSKEVLVSASITQMADTWSERGFINTDLQDPIERIMHLFKTLERQATSKDFCGCPMVNTSIERRDSPDLAMDAARTYKDQLYVYFKQQAMLLKAEDPDVLAEQLLLLYDGCNAWIVMRRQFPKSVFASLDLLLSSKR